jgi:hypothetical protein
MRILLLEYESLKFPPFSPVIHITKYYSQLTFLAADFVGFVRFNKQSGFKIILGIAMPVSVFQIRATIRVNGLPIFTLAP